MSAHYTNLEKQIEDLGRNASETRVQIDTTTSQVSRLQENITRVSVFSFRQRCVFLHILSMFVFIACTSPCILFISSILSDNLFCSDSTLRNISFIFETCVQIDTTASQVTRLQENITSLTQTAATVNITIMNLEIKATEYDKLEQIIQRVTKEL
jgi:peptidoglycan hydrolase CwlO-like protein